MIDFVSGFVSGLFTYEYLPHDLIHQIMTARVFDTYLNIMYEKKIVYKNRFNHIFLYCLFICFISYAYIHEV